MIVWCQLLITLAQWVVDWETLVILESSTIGRTLPLEVPGVIPRRMKVEVPELPGGFSLSSQSAIGVIRFIKTTSVSTPGPTTAAQLSSVSTHLLLRRHLSCSNSFCLPYCQPTVKVFSDWDSLLQQRGLCNEE